MNRRNERGTGTLAGVLLMGVVLTIGVTCAAVIGLVGAHRQAAVAADLGALSGAQAQATGQDACAAAAAITRRNGADLHSCRVLAGDVLVEVWVLSPRWLGQQVHLTGRARAGPVGGGASLHPSGAG